MLVAASCGIPSIATQSLGNGTFENPNSQTIKVGEQVRYDNSHGGVHNLVTTESGAPSEFSGGGLAFAGGETKDITFSTAGTFHITCSIHPSMQETVTVNAN
jgi:plastocyanin